MRLRADGGTFALQIIAVAWLRWDPCAKAAFRRAWQAGAGSVAARKSSARVRDERLGGSALVLPFSSEQQASSSFPKFANARTIESLHSQGLLVLAKDVKVKRRARK